MADFNDSAECTDEMDFGDLIEDSDVEASADRFDYDDIAALLTLE